MRAIWLFLVLYHWSTNGQDSDCNIEQLFLKSVSHDSFTVTWDGVNCSLNVSSYYRAQYRLYGSYHINGIKNVKTGIRQFTATSLHSLTHYIAEVAIVSEAGIGPYHNLSVTTSYIPFVTYLRGVVYPNNSIVNLQDIGQHSGAGLFCYTNLINCCRRSDDPKSRVKGYWRFPSGLGVGIKSSSTSKMFSRSRGRNSVILYRGNLATDYGLFTCRIPDANLKNQFIFIGIYPKNKGAPEVTHLTYEVELGVLICVSTGGPATDVSWNKRGHQNQTVISTWTSTYHNWLTILSSDISDYSGFFSCTVQNRRGNSSRRIGPYRSIALSGQRDSYQVNSKAKVICYSNLTVTYIKWINSKNQEVMLESKYQSELSLSVSIISNDLDGSEYSCEVHIKSPLSQQIIVVMTSFKVHIMNTSQEIRNSSKNVLISVAVLIPLSAIVTVAVFIIVILVAIRYKSSRISPEAVTSNTDEARSSQDDTPADIVMVNCSSYGIVATEDFRNINDVPSIIEPSEIYETIY